MPTRDDITELDLERIRALLIDILSSDKYCALFKLQEVDGWQLLVNARNRLLS